MTIPITSLLDGKSNDITNCISFTEALSVRIRDEIELFHYRWYSEVVSLFSKVDVQVCMPRASSRPAT